MKAPSLSPAIIITVALGSHKNGCELQSILDVDPVLLALANLVSIPLPTESPGEASLLPVPIRPHQNCAKESLCGCSLKCQHGVGVHSEGRRGPLPQNGITVWPSAPQSFCNCGQGLLEYLNDPVNLGLYIAFTVGCSKPAQSGVYGWCAWRIWQKLNQ